MERLRKMSPAACLACLAFLFLLIRLTPVLALPIFNDEAIYTQYAQLIQGDPQGYKYISVFNQFHDWKPPLQYWLGALAVGLGRDPVLAVRLLTVFISLLGMFGMYMLAKELWGKKTGLAAALLYALCPAVLLYGVQFIAEPFLIAAAPWFYWSVLRTFAADKIRLRFLAAAALLGSALVLLKQSGVLFLLMALCLPWFRSMDRGPGWGRIVRRRLLASLAITLSALVLPRIILPLRFWADSTDFNSRWVLSLEEMAAWPRDIWLNNAGMVGDYYLRVYSLFALALLGFFLYRVWRGRGPAELGLAAMFLWGSLAVVTGLRGFNDYIYNTALVTLILLMLARVLAFPPAARLGRAAVLVLGAALALNWGWQIARLSVSPAQYFLRSTAWMQQNYVRGWPTGFGIPETVKFLKEQPGPGLVFVDPQWGNPGTSLEVYRDQYPQLRVAKISDQFQEVSNAEQFQQKARKIYTTRLVIFSANPNGRSHWQDSVYKYLCSERREIKAAPEQMPIVICRY